MAQFDVYRNPDPSTSKLFPYVVDLQAGLLDRLSTRVVAPLASNAATPTPLTRLNPSFEIEETTVVLSTQELAGVPRAILGEVVASVADRRDDIVAALDLLFAGA